MPVVTHLKKSPKSVVANLCLFEELVLSSYLTLLSEVIVEKCIEKRVTLPRI